MTISSLSNKVEFVCSGATKTFNFPYYFILKSDIKVYRKVGNNPKELLVLDTDYTISGTPSDPANMSVYREGADIILTDFPEVDTKLSIQRVVAYTQLTDYVENDKFPAELHEQALDKLTMLVQQLKEVADRSVAVDTFSDVTPETLFEHVERVWRSIDNVDITATNMSDVNTNALNIDDINTNALNIADIVKVALYIAAVNNVSFNMIAINKVDHDLMVEKYIETVAKDLQDDEKQYIKKNAENLANIIAAAENETNINAAVANETNINAAVANEANITAAAENETNINAVVANETNINAVNANKTHIDYVANKGEQILNEISNIMGLIGFSVISGGEVNDATVDIIDCGTIA